MDAKALPSLLRSAVRGLEWSRRLKRTAGAPNWDARYAILVQCLRDVFARTSTMSARERRDGFAAVTPPSLMARKVGRVSTSLGGVPAMWFEPRDLYGSRVIFFLHGGAYQFGSLVEYADWCARLAIDAGLRVVAIDYRLAPEHVFPAATDDALSAFRALRAAGEADIVLAGDSAGGNLVLETLLRLRDDGDRLPRRSVLVCPWLDLAVERDSRFTNARWDTIRRENAVGWSRVYAPAGSLRDPRISPIYATLAGLPPLLIQGGSREILYDEILEFADLADRSGVDVTLSIFPDMVHDWHVFAPFGVPESIRAIREMAHYLRA